MAAQAGLAPATHGSSNHRSTIGAIEPFYSPPCNTTSLIFSTPARLLAGLLNYLPSLESYCLKEQVQQVPVLSCRFNAKNNFFSFTFLQ